MGEADPQQMGVYQMGVYQMGVYKSARGEYWLAQQHSEDDRAGERVNPSSADPRRIR
jgi:hypothetical protein